MAQRDTRSRTTRVDTPLNIERNPVQLQPSRSAFSSRGNDQAVRQANALKNALGAGIGLYNTIQEDRTKKFNLAGQNAALEGRELTDDESTNDRFMQGYQRITNERDIIEMENDLNAWYDETDTSKMTSEQVLKAAAEAIFRPNLEGFDNNLDDDLDRESAEMYGGAVEALEQSLMKRHQEDSQEHLQNEVDAAFEISTNKRLRNGTYSLDELNGQMFSVYGPKQANDEIVDLISSIAIEQGRPELVQELMDKTHWKGGPPAPGGIRDFDAKLLNALRQARATQEYDLGVGQREAENLHKKEQQAAGNEVMNLIVNPDDDNPVKATALLDQHQRDGTIDWQVAAQLRTSINTYRNMSLGDAAPEFDNMWELELELASGLKGIDDVNAAARNGVYGTGKEGQKNFASAQARARAIENFRRSDPLFQSKIEEFDAQYTLGMRYEQQYPQIKRDRAIANTKILELMDTSKGEDDAGNVLPNYTIDEATKKVLNDLPPKDNEHYVNTYGGFAEITTTLSDWKSGKSGVTSRTVMDERDRTQWPNEDDYILHLITTDALDPDEDEERFREGL